MWRTVGFVMYALGIVIAISGAAKVPAENQQWPDTLPWFAAGVFVCCIGLVCWRLSLRA